MTTETFDNQQLTAATDRLNAAVKTRKDLEARIQAAQVRIRKAEDYREIMNLMSAHVHCCLNQDFALELDRYWSKRDDIAYANGDLAYVGQDAVRRYYVDSHTAEAARAHEVLQKSKNTAVSGTKAPGYKNMNLIGTPYIEIAEDGQTAQGIWMVHSFNGRVDDEGCLKTQGVLSRYSGEFIREDGQWKIWHRRNYADVVFDESPTERLGKGGIPPKPLVENPKPAETVKIQIPEEMYSSEAIPSGFPPIPEPYQTWSYETSNVRKEAP